MAKEIDLSGLTKRQALALLKDVAAECERAFRRGFQQGSIMARGGFVDAGVKPADDAKVADWRFKENCHKATRPPGTPGFVTSAVERLNIEADGHGPLRTLIHLAESKP